MFACIFHSSIYHDILFILLIFLTRIQFYDDFIFCLYSFRMWTPLLCLIYAILPFLAWTTYRDVCILCLASPGFVESLPLPINLLYLYQLFDASVFLSFGKYYLNSIVTVALYFPGTCMPNWSTSFWIVKLVEVVLYIRHGHWMWVETRGSIVISNSP